MSRETSRNWRLAMPNTNGHGPKRAILYARVSTDEQARSGYSLAQQIEALRTYAAREGYEVLEKVSETPERAAQALRGLVWTACGISWPPGEYRRSSHRTGTVSAANLRSCICCGRSSRPMEQGSNPSMTAAMIARRGS